MVGFLRSYPFYSRMRAKLEFSPYHIELYRLNENYLDFNLI